MTSHPLWFVLACTNLGMMLDQGDGVPKDLARAAEFLGRGCAAADLSGYYELGRVLSGACAPLRDEKRAAQLFQQTCEGGNEQACGALGCCTTSERQSRRATRARSLSTIVRAKRRA
jgi:TPR repeat protein